MKLECPNCEREVDTGEAKREDSFCGYCGASLRDIDAELEHNKKEIEKLRWKNKSQSDS